MTRAMSMVVLIEVFDQLIYSAATGPKGQMRDGRNHMRETKHWIGSDSQVVASSM